MDVAVGLDVAKEFHWAVATRLDPETGRALPVLNRRVDNEPDAITELITDLITDLDELVHPGESVQVGIDILGGIAQLLDHHPDAALIKTLPGMGAVLTAEFLAVAGGIQRFDTGDQLAAAAGLAPVLNQSGKVRYLQRPLSGDRTLKRVFYQSAFCALQRDPTSRAYYARKRAEGKTHHQALIALVNRPGMSGDSIRWKDEVHGTSLEVPAGIAGARGPSGGGVEA